MIIRVRRLVAILSGVAAVSALALTGAANAHTPTLSKPTNTKPVAVEAFPHPAPLVLHLRYARHATFDRVVIDLSGPLTGYRVGYVPKLVYDGSGKAVPLAGKAFLQINVDPANAHAFVGETALNVYSGPRLTRPALPTVKGIAFTGDHESVVSFGLALDHKAGVRVFTLTDPNRLVVDVAH
jgi:hypothetical protein